MGKTRRQEKSYFNDGPDEIRVEDLVEYATKINKKKKRRKSRDNFEEEYYDYVDQRITDAIPDEEKDQ